MAPTPLSKQIGDLDTPISFLPARLQRTAGELRVRMHLLNALNALQEAGHYAEGRRRKQHLLGVTIVRALFEGLQNEQMEDRLAALRRPAEALLAEAARLDDEVEEGRMERYALDDHNAAKAKEFFLSRVFQYADWFIEPCERTRETVEGELCEKGFSYKKLLAAAEHHRVPADEDMWVRAEELATYVVGDLFWESSLLTLHGTPVRSDNFADVVERVARVVAYLMVQGGAEPERLAKATLLVLNVPANRLESFFSPKAIRTAHAMAFPKAP